MKSAILFCFTFCSLCSLDAQEELFSKFVSGITSEELREHVKILSSDGFMGREAGFEGEQLAADYIIENFINLNLKGTASREKPFFQEFALHKRGWDSFYLISGQDTLSINQDIQVSGFWDEGDKEIDLVFAGYGADAEYYSDYTNLDVSGKIVAFLRGEPMDKNGLFLSTKTYVPQYSLIGYDKASIAAKHGALGAILIHPDQDQVDKIIRINNRFSKAELYSLPGRSENKLMTGLINISEESAIKLFDNDIRDWDNYRKKLNKGKQVNFKSKNTVRLVSEKGSNKVVCENVVGMIRGSEIPDEYIIITAHYDHLGKRDSTIFNGADDNASGTAAVLEIAEAFAYAASEGFAPRRSIIFIPVSGEEKGLLGSKYYTSNPLVPLESTKAAINMDMIGRQDDYNQDTSYVFLYISDEKGSKLDIMAAKSNQIVGDDILTVMKYSDTNEFNIGGSDHASFEKMGIPVMYYHCGTHEDYHRPSDTWEKLDYNNMTKITRMVFASAWQLANEN